ncbi:MAG TPA: F0F1 ATP synthase subunit alpha, partial [bacterium]|nr:F0F1 ATP synthase subunit alpha [bacterium]
MQIKPEEISSIIESKLKNYRTSVDAAEEGIVLQINDGIARVSGLSNAMSGELLEFPNNIKGIVLNLEEGNIGVAILGDFKQIREGDRVRLTGKIAEVPTGKAMIGRVVDALGQPIDGKGEIKAEAYSYIEKIAPGVIERQPVKEPLYTGIKAIDGMIPIGR